jgi:hypothetical protein
VVPGQYVFAASSGAVLIPDGHIDEVLAEARKVEATDAASRDRSPASRFARTITFASSPRACSTRGAPFAWMRASRKSSVRRPERTNSERDS